MESHGKSVYRWYSHWTLYRWFSIATEGLWNDHDSWSWFMIMKWSGFPGFESTKGSEVGNNGRLQESLALATWHHGMVSDAGESELEAGDISMLYCRKSNPDVASKGVGPSRNFVTSPVQSICRHRRPRTSLFPWKRESPVFFLSLLFESDRAVNP